MQGMGSEGTGGVSGEYETGLKETLGFVGDKEKCFGN